MLLFELLGNYNGLSSNGLTNSNNNANGVIQNQQASQTVGPAQAQKKP